MFKAIEQRFQLEPMTELFTDTGAKQKPVNPVNPVNQAKPRFKDVLDETRAEPLSERRNAFKMNARRGDNRVEPKRSDKPEESEAGETAGGETAAAGMVSQNNVVFILEGETEEDGLCITEITGTSDTAAVTQQNESAENTTEMPENRAETTVNTRESEPAADNANAAQTAEEAVKSLINDKSAKVQTTQSQAADNTKPTNEAAPTTETAPTREAAPTKETTPEAEAESIAEPQQKPETAPKAETASATETAPKVETQPTAETAPDETEETEAVRRTETEPTVKAEPTADTAPVVKAEPTADTVPAAKAEPKTEAVPKTETQPAAEDAPKTQPTAETAQSAETTPTAEAKPTAEAVPTAETEPKSETVPAAEAKPTAETAQSAGTEPTDKTKTTPTVKAAPKQGEEKQTATQTQERTDTAQTVWRNENADTRTDTTVKPEFSDTPDETVVTGVETGKKDGHKTAADNSDGKTAAKGTTDSDNTIEKIMARTPETTERTGEEKSGEKSSSEHSDPWLLENENDTSTPKGDKIKDESTDSVKDTKKTERAKSASVPAAETHHTIDVKAENLSSLRQLRATAQTAQNTPVPRENMFEAMVERIELMKTADMHSMSIKLNPEFLGDVTLKISMAADGLHVKIGAGNSDVTSSINSQINSLIETLSEKGITVAKVDVAYTGVDSNPFGDKNGQQQGRRSGTNRRTSTRRSGDQMVYALNALEEMSGYLDMGVSSVEYRA